jgi:GNAT superfamily N-acetyltransferase
MASFLSNPNRRKIGGMMLTIQKIDPDRRDHVQRFVSIPYRIYAGHAQWVPPLMIDAEMQLNRKKHPFYEHSEADFWIASRDGRDVGRIAALHNRRYNDYHHSHTANFYLFECEDDSEAASALFERVFEWARQRGLNRLVGPKGFGVLDGYGLIVEGYEHRQVMNMMNYNYPYYPALVERLGFVKEVDFVSCYLGTNFQLPERVHKIAQRVLERGALGVQRFDNKAQLKAWANRIGKAYNQAFVNNWEYAPMTDREIAFILDNLLTVADPRLIKVITHEQEAVGFLFGFPDLSAAMQRARGRLLPFGLIDLLMEMRRTNWIALNGAGILPEFQGRGGNALLYAEMENTIRQYHFEHADLTQVAETAVQMRSDLENVGGKMYKNHRVYRKEL